jgi:hypothetical protein
MFKKIFILSIVTISIAAFSAPAMSFGGPGAGKKSFSKAKSFNKSGNSYKRSSKPGRNFSNQKPGNNFNRSGNGFNRSSNSFNKRPGNNFNRPGNSFNKRPGNNFNRPGNKFGNKPSGPGLNKNFNGKPGHPNGKPQHIATNPGQNVKGPKHKEKINKNGMVNNKLEKHYDANGDGYIDAHEAQAMKKDSHWKTDKLKIQNSNASIPETPTLDNVELVQPTVNAVSIDDVLE